MIDAYGIMGCNMRIIEICTGIIEILHYIQKISTDIPTFLKSNFLQAFYLHTHTLSLFIYRYKIKASNNRYSTSEIMNLMHFDVISK